MFIVVERGSDPLSGEPKVRLTFRSNMPLGIVLWGRRVRVGRDSLVIVDERGPTGVVMLDAAVVAVRRNAVGLVDLEDDNAPVITLENDETPREAVLRAWATKRPSCSYAP